VQSPVKSAMGQAWRPTEAAKNVISTNDSSKILIDVSISISFLTNVLGHNSFDNGFVGCWP
jgi:hypothetical protein